jgi:hypothetical protein
VHMLTTVDNPYDPFTQYKEWYRFDEAAGYHTTGLLARFVSTSYELSDADYDQAIEDGMKDVIDLNPLGVHRLVEMGEMTTP